MRLALSVLALLAVAGCASTQPGSARDVEQSKEQIQVMIEDVIKSMLENKPEIYYNHLCERDRRTRPLEELVEAYEAEGEFMRERALSMSVAEIGVGDSAFDERGDKLKITNPNIASVMIEAPNHPWRLLLIEAIREGGVWKIRESMKPMKPRDTRSGAR